MKVSVARRTLPLLTVALLAVGLVTLLMSGALIPTVVAQSGWDRSRVLDPEGTEPIVLADQQGGIHYFWGRDGYIMYAYKSHDSASLISVGVDILETSSPAFDAVISDERIHIVFLNGTELYHSSAPIGEARSSANWREPDLIDYANGINSPSMAINEDGKLFVVYVILNDTQRAVRLVTSEDGGKIWANPRTLANYNATPEAPDNPDVATDGGNVVSVAWETDEAPAAWPPTGIFYTRSTDEGLSWEEPYRFVEGFYMFPRIGIDGQGTYFLVWSGTDVDKGRYSSISYDQGVTWAETEELGSSLASRTGEDRLIQDGDGNLHWIIGGGGNALFHAAYNEGAWHLDSFQATCSERPGADIALGNNLVVAWENRCDGGTLYTSKELDAQRLEPIAISRANAEPEPEVDQEADSTQAPPVADVDRNEQGVELPDYLVSQEPPPASNSFQALLVGTLIALFVVAIVLLIVIRSRAG